MINSQIKENKMKARTLVIIGVLVVLGLVLTFSSCSIVRPGHRGVKVTMGAVSDKVLNEGVYFKAPFFQRIVKIPVMVQQASYENLAAASSSMQDVFSNVNLSYHIKPERVNVYYKRFGSNPKSVMDLMLSAKLQEIVKATTNNYTTEQLLGKRSEVRDIIYNKIKVVAELQDVIIDEFSMTNFSFGQAYQNAIEEKQVMEQKAETARRAKEVAQQEGEAKIIAARAESEANRLRQVSITPQLIRYEEVQVLKSKWDGKLPQVTGGATPLLNLGN